MSKKTNDNFEKLLSGGHPNSLGNTLQVVDEVIKSPERITELFQCYFCDDPVVRLRTSSSLKRLAKMNIEWLTPYTQSLLWEVSEIEQASTQWTLAELYRFLFDDMDSQQKTRARAVLKRNLVKSNDWIVLINTMQTLAEWAEDNPRLKDWLHDRLASLKGDARKSVAKRAGKLYQNLYLEIENKV